MTFLYNEEESFGENFVFCYRFCCHELLWLRKTFHQGTSKPKDPVPVPSLRVISFFFKLFHWFTSLTRPLSLILTLQYNPSVECSSIVSSFFPFKLLLQLWLYMCVHEEKVEDSVDNLTTRVARTRGIQTYCCYLKERERERNKNAAGSMDGAGKSLKPIQHRFHILKKKHGLARSDPPLIQTTDLSTTTQFIYSEHRLVKTRPSCM